MRCAKSGMVEATFIRLTAHGTFKLSTAFINLDYFPASS
jgi:hypothetical protein